MDITKWATDNLLEDFLKKPIKITIENVSDKYVISGTLQVFKKEREKDGKIKVDNSIRKNKKRKNTNVAQNFARKDS